MSSPPNHAGFNLCFASHILVPAALVSQAKAEEQAENEVAEAKAKVEEAKVDADRVASLKNMAEAYACLVAEGEVEANSPSRSQIQ